jgi:O-succinylbenzoic acid--CoA ligase
VARLVALRFPHPIAMLAALDQVWSDGDVALPLDPSAPDAVTDALLARLRPGALRSTSGTEPTGHDTTVPDGAALVIATSGTTGQRTGVVLSHAALAASTSLSRARLEAADGVPWLGVLPLHHVAGISVVLRSRAAGRAPALHQRATAAVINAAEPSWISLVPTQLGQLLDVGADLARHAGVVLGGAAAPPGLLQRADARGVHVVTSYGATETCGGCVYDGRPLDDVAVRLDDAGRIELRTPTAATGLWRGDGTLDPVVDNDGWWRTSDLGRLEDGVLSVLGRADDVVVSGGENVPLAPVRTALATVQGLAASGVVGLPHERWGTSVTAVVVAEHHQSAPSLAELREALRPVLDPAHLPTGLVVAASLPHDAMGKLTPAAVASSVTTGSATLET